MRGICGPHRGLVALIFAQVTVAAWAAPALAQTGTTRARGSEPAEDECALLQTKAALSPRASPMSPSVPAEAPSSLELPTPVLWFHVPKCGTSFLNTLIHVDGVCPGIPASKIVNEDPFSAIHQQGGGLWLFNKTYATEKNCPGLNVDHLYHRGIGSIYDEAQGRLVTFLRQPEQRLISNYHYAYESEVPTVGEYAALNNTPGCAVKMLTRDLIYSCTRGLPPSSGEVALAKQRLREGFAFVGITEEWDLSICLFNRMFGNTCEWFQFKNSHRGPSHSTQPYDTAPLGGWRDVYDGPLYEEAQDIFREKLALWNVSQESCEPCFRQAGLL